MKRLKSSNRMLSLVLVGSLLFTVAGVQTVSAAETPTIGEGSTYWVVKPVTTSSSISESDTQIVMTNGLVERIFSKSANMTTVSYKNLYTGASMLAGANPQPDAVIGLDGQMFEVGGSGSSSKTFQFKSYQAGDPIKPYEWTPKSYSDPLDKDKPWAPKGKAITITYEASPDFPDAYKGITIEVHYEIYDGIPVISKTVKVINNGTTNTVVTSLTAEQLALASSNKDKIYLETDFKGDEHNIWRNNDIGRTIKWQNDTDYSLVSSKYEHGPAQTLQTGQSFESFRTFELLHSVDFFEWKQMEIKKMYRTLFPQITDNPIFMHLIADDSATIRKAVDQATGAGFEMIFQSFGSGANTESTDQAYINRHKADYDYAHSKGIYMGAYTMVAARGDQPASDSYQEVWGNMRDLSSPTFNTFWTNTKNFIDKTGLDALEFDGPYPMSINSKYPESSQVNQWTNATKQMGIDVRQRGMYANAADWFYLNGYNKNGIGYEEIAWSQPRQEQLIFGRQAIYNATFQKTPSMGWSFVPIENYHGGGSTASFEPLSQNISDYDFVLAQNFGSGVMAAYRGKELYDSEGTKAVVTKWTDFYKKYKAILNSDIVHIKAPEFDPNNTKRTTGLDAIIHVNTQTKEKGLMMVYNQTDTPRTETISVPLYYTGLTNLQNPPVPVPGSHPKQLKKYGTYPVYDPYLPAAPATYDYPTAQPTNKQVTLSQEGLSNKTYKIDSNGNVLLQVTIPPMSYTWFTAYAPEDAPDTGSLLIPTEVTATSINDHEVSLKWQAPSSPGISIGGYNIYRNGTILAKTLASSFTDQGLNEQTQYIYEISAINGAGSLEGAKSASVSVTTAADSNPPVIRSAGALSGSTVQVEFSEPLDKGSAEKLSNYAINNGVTISSAILQADNKKVTLTVSPMQSEHTYELTVNAVKDTSLAQNPIASDSKMSFQYGPLRAYSLDETSGAAVIDSVNNNNGTIKGNILRVPGLFGNAIQLDGSGFLDIGNNVVNNLEHFSAEAWIKPDSGNDPNAQVIIAQQQTDITTNQWSLYLKNGKLLFSISDGSSAASLLLGDEATAVVKERQWNHVAITRNQDTYNLYLNGKKIATKASIATISQANNPNNMYIGADLNLAGSGPDHLFKGAVDDIRFYNAVLSDSSIQQHAGILNNNQIPVDPSYAYLYDYYKMDETSGTTVADSVGRSTGTINGTASWMTGKVGGAINLNGSTDDLNLGAGNIGHSGQFTLESWIKTNTTSTSSQTIFAQQQSGAAPNSFWWYLNGNALWINYSNEQGTTINIKGGTITANNWYHVALTRNDKTIKLYLNGQKVAEQSSSIFLDQPNNPYPMRIGGNSNGSSILHRFNGLIDEFRIYYTALDGEAISNHYSAELAAFQVYADNGTAAVKLNSIPASTPMLADFSASLQINGGVKQALPINDFHYDSSSRTAIMHFTPLLETNVVQNANVEVVYQGKASTNQFVVPVKLDSVADKTPPLSIASVSPAEPNGSNGWYTSDVTVSLSVNDNLSGVAKTEYQVNDGEWMTYSGTIPAFGEGIYKVGYRSTDQAGNVELTKTIELKVDKTAPTAVLESVTSDTYGQNGWYSHPITLELSSSDNGSGVAKTEYSLDGGTTWITYSAPVTFAQDGVYSISYRTMDKAGNHEAAKTVSFNLDTTAPTIGVTVPGDNNIYQNTGELTPEIVLTDELSGIDSSKTTMMLDTNSYHYGTTISLYTLPLGLHTLVVSSSDLAGNQKSKTVVFQTVASIDSLQVLVTYFATNHGIDNAGIANSLQSKLAHNNLSGFVREVEAQSGKHISIEAAQCLLRDAQYLLSQK
ncbi:hypothetical protein GC102_21650 [Paenibacillus sp. LMG 31460]|uniref:Fibronectin type-III domain-containing protein n=1 Tax=Paenibacillus germinis TaxID=2654979 RepID=A0ABX1Z7R9_9BACL|nr:LamG-like jellyroll fold domain-containing protein [Paenibacillus germinis]NOU88344.1 hypothetical protein [Paenibacillus germinis]